MVRKGLIIMSNTYDYVNNKRDLHITSMNKY